MSRTANRTGGGPTRGVRPAVLAGAGLAVLTLVVGAGTVALALADGVSGETWGLLSFALPCGLVGAVIVAARPANPVGWLFVATGLGFAGQQLAGHWALYDRVQAPLPGAAVAAWLETWLWAPALISVLTFLPLVFPDGKLLSPRWRPVAWAAAVWLAVAVTLSAFYPGGEHIAVGADTGIVNPLGVEAVRGLGWVLDAVVPLTWLALSAAGVISLVLRYRRVGGDQRQQLKWLAYAIALVVIAEPVTALTGFPPDGLGPGLLVPLAAAVALLRYRLYDIDRLINRTLVYAALTACGIALYVSAVAVLGAIVRTEDDLVVSLIGAGLVAVVFAPLRERLQRAVNRLLYGDRADPYGALALLGRRLEATIQPDAVLSVVVRTVAETLHLPYVALEVDGPDGVVTAAEHGVPPDDDGRRTTVSLPYAGAEVGRLVLAGRDLSPADRRVLADLARQVGAAVHAVRLSTDLQHSRERLVTAREEERRRLGRELHDGLGPQLAGLGMKVEAARALIATRPDRAEAMLLGLADQTEAAVGDLRRMAYLLRPPVLDSVGLVDALRAQAAQQPVPVDVEAPEGLGPLPAAIEVAVYRIGVEALRNVTRHAAASACTLRLDVAGDLVRLEVSDDGRGIAEDATAGVGLSSMRERAAELGGRCTVGPGAAGGTRVLAELPCPVGAGVD